MRSLWSVVLLVLALVVAGCSDDADEQEAEPTPAPTGAADGADGADGGEDADDVEQDPAVLSRIADAVETTVAEGTARFTMSAGGSAEGSGQQLAEGVEDFAEQRRQITFTGPQGELDAVVDGSETYVEVPFLEGASWLRVDFADLGGGALGGPIGLPLQDPGGALALLRGTPSAGAREVGAEEVSGVDTDRYAVTLDLREAAEQADSLAGGDVAGAMVQTGARTLVMDVWIDSEDLIRRVAYSLDIDPTEVQAGDATISAGGPGTARFDYSDFGTDAEVAIPSDDAVVELDEEAIREGLEGLEGLTGNR